MAVHALEEKFFQLGLLLKYFTGRRYELLVVTYYCSGALNIRCLQSSGGRVDQIGNQNIDHLADHCAA